MTLTPTVVSEMAKDQDDDNDDTLLPRKEVRKRVGISNSTMDRAEDDGLFPKRVRIGYRVFWVEREINEWIRFHMADR
jgi:predicted DNA-binding transcriptional regulator AlpA